MRRVFVLAFAFVISFFSQSSHAQTVDDFQMELEAYVATHTQEEVAAHALTLIVQLTSEAEQSSFTLNSVLLSDGVLLSDNVITELTGALLTEAYRLRNQRRACRLTYKADLFTSAAVASGILASCNEITSLSGFLACAAGALDTHAAQITEAQQRSIACY